MRITCGVDWAERHHDIAVVDDDGVVLDKRRIDVGVEGVSELLDMLAEHAADIADVPVAIERRSRS